MPVGNKFMRGFQGITDLPCKWIKPLKNCQGMGKQVIKRMPLAYMSLFMLQYIMKFSFRQCRLIDIQVPEKREG